jgi:hypothetical protein
MKKLFWIFLLSLLTATTFYSVEAMKVEEKTNTEDLSLNLLESLQAAVGEPISFLGGGLIFHITNVDCNADDDNAIMHFHVIFAGKYAPWPTADNIIAGILSFRKKKDGNLFVRLAIYGYKSHEDIIKTLTGSVPLTIETPKDAKGICRQIAKGEKLSRVIKNISDICASFIISFILGYGQGTNTLKLACSECHQPITNLIENEKGRVARISPRRYLACGHILCKQCSGQWDKEQPLIKRTCPACNSNLFRPDDCFDATEATIPLHMLC